MNTFKALASFATGHFKARADRRTASLINALPNEVQKDIGWKWSPARREKASKPSLNWDLF